MTTLQTVVQGGIQQVTQGGVQHVTLGGVKQVTQGQVRGEGLQGWGLQLAGAALMLRMRRSRQLSPISNRERYYLR